MSTETGLLIAEPDGERRTAYAALLHQAGYHVTGVSDAAAALVEVSQRPPALIILRLADVAADGLDLCRQVRASAETRDTPVIVLTMQDGAYLREQVVRSGATAILAEPLKTTLLLRQVRRLLARSRSRGSLRN